MNNQFIIDKVIEQGVLPLFYHESETETIDITRALYEAGISVIEYTNRGVAALNNFKALLKVRDQQMPGLLIGIGTIKTPAQAKEYMDAGADFIICPGLSTAVAACVQERGKLWVPGCMTPSEIMQAEEAGATFIKLFPGNLLKPAFVSAIKELFPAISFMPTGGVEVEEKNLSEWFKSGVVAVGMGSKLITKEIVAQKNYALLAQQTQQAIQLIKEIRS